MNATQVSIARKLLAAMQQLLVILLSKTMKDPIIAGDAPLYTLAKAAIGKHLTLDPNIPSDVGCAEAVSYLLWKLGAPIPSKGIAGTAALEAWVVASGLFIKRAHAGIGFLIFSSTGTGNGTVEGHTGVLAFFNLQFKNDWGILSNNSDNGLFQEKWSLDAWTKNYVVKGELNLNFYEYVGPTIA